jgi:uncharacterized protein
MHPGSSPAPFGAGCRTPAGVAGARPPVEADPREADAATRPGDREERTMSDHPNVQRMRDGYDAFAKGDLAALRELMTEDIVWHVPGHSALAGDYSGIEAVLAFFGRIMESTGGSFRAEPLTLLADEHYGAAPVKITAHRGDRHLDVMNVQASRLVDGRVAEFWDTSTDPDATEAFFA